MRTPDLATLDRALRRASVRRAARALHGDALDNARRSLTAISRSRSDRAELQSSLAAPAVAGDLGALGTDECLALLRTRQVGRMAYVARAGVPQIVPVNYELAGRHVIVRTGPGPLVQAAQRCDHVAFEVDDLDEERHAGWSVVVHGTLTELHPSDPRALSDPTPWARGPRRHLLQLESRLVTGRRLLGHAHP